MADETDLRTYIEVLARNWMWITGLTVGAAVVAFVVASFLTRQYTTSALILVTDPRYEMSFDSRVDTEDRRPAYQVFPVLATSHAVLQAVVDAYAPTAQAGIEEWDVWTLSEMVESGLEADGSLVELTVTSRSPQDAAAIANQWAELLVRHANKIYAESEENVSFFEQQLQQAEDALQQAEAALVEFEASNQSSAVRAQLDSYRHVQLEGLASQRAIEFTIQDVEGLRTQLAGQPRDLPVSLADDLTALLLQIKAFNADTSTPIELQVEAGGEILDKTLSEQIDFLDELVMTLQARSAEIEARIAETQPKILDLQKENEQINVESRRLVRVRDLASETTLAVSRKLDEARIAAQEEGGISQIGSQASVPEKHSSPRRSLIAVIAAVLGLAVGVFLVFFVEYWRQSSERQASGK